MAKRSGSNNVSYWGRFPTPADLPNAAAAALQTSNVETGDIAFAISTGLLYVCTTATVGAAVWASLQPTLGFANTATAGGAATAGAAATALRSDVNIPIQFGGDAQGDLAVRGAANYQRLALGTAGFVLAAGATLPAWTDPTTLQIGPYIHAPNSFAADFNLATQVTSPIVLVTTAGGAVNITNANSLTKDVLVRIVKTNTGTNGITLKCPVGWTINGGTVSTDLVIPGTTSAAKEIAWIHSDIANLALYVHPVSVNGALWWYG